MATLMTIPEELRDKIIEDVILAQRSPPRDAASAYSDRTHIARSRSSGIRAWDYGPANVLFEKAPTIPNANGLLLTNRHLHEQTERALKRLFPEGVRNKLDVLFVNERQLLPTWIHLPVFRKHLEGIDVTFRIFGYNDSSGENAFTVGDGSPQQILWCFYWLMEQFLDYGLTPPTTLIKSFNENTKNRTHKKGLSIQTLSLDFHTGEPRLAPEDTDENRQSWWDRQREMRRHRDGGMRLYRDVSHGYHPFGPDPEPKCLHPKWLSDFIAADIRGLASMSYHTAAYGSLIHERIGQINILCQGEEQTPGIAPGEILAKMQAAPHEMSRHECQDTFGHMHSDCRLFTFWNWKFRAVGERRARGFPMPKDVVWPSLMELRWWREGREKYRKEIEGQGWAFGCREERCLCADRDLDKMLEEKDRGGSR